MSKEFKITVVFLLVVIMFITGQQIGYHTRHDVTLATVTNRIKLDGNMSGPCLVEFTDQQGRTYTWENSDSDIHETESYILTLNDTGKVIDIKYQY